jgi:uncharacterized membrane protein YqaE (UPF0057 family)
MNGIDLTKIIASIIVPITDFLKQKGLWDITVNLYNLVSGTIIALWSWLNSNIGLHNMSDLIVSFIKFVLNIFLTLFSVLSNIVTWILHLFK